MKCEYDQLEFDLLNALHHGKAQTASRMLACLQAEFPNSARVQRLQAKHYAVEGQIDKAIDICKQIISNDPADISTWKTLVSCQKGAGQLELASDALLELIDLIPSDVTCWHELVDLYIRQRQFSYALFSIEELLLLRPACYSSYLMYAEVLVSMGDKQSLELARQYYAMSIELNPDRNPRALYGLLMLCKSPSQKKPIVQELLEFSLKRLLALYNSKNSALVRFARIIGTS